MADKKSIGEKEKGLNFMQRLLQNDNARKIIVVVGVVAILVIFLSSFFGGNKKQTTNTETVQQTSASAQSVDDFKTQTEQSLTNLINGIEGVGNASVLVTIEKSSEQVYACLLYTSCCAVRPLFGSTWYSKYRQTFCKSIGRSLLMELG